MVWAEVEPLGEWLADHTTPTKNPSAANPKAKRIGKVPELVAAASMGTLDVKAELDRIVM